MDYNSIKQLAKERGSSVQDYIVLAPANDPFYCGSRGEVAKAEWFMRIVKRFGHNANGKCHLRRLHYKLWQLSVPKANGDVYENTKADWAYLMNSGKYARYLGLVSPDIFLDLRNKKPSYAFSPTWSEAPSFYLRTWDNTDISTPEFPELPDFELASGQARQDCHVEVWIEKSTMNDVLLPVCKKYGVDAVVGMGELSITNVRDFFRRARRADKPVVILYIADFDPAGYRMPVSVARKIEFFTQSEYGLDITLHPIMLTQAQVDQYELPPMPFVKAVNARKAANMPVFSDYAVELDALEAIHPGVFAELVSVEIERYIDLTLNDKHQTVFETMRDTVDSRRDDALEPFAEDWEYLQAHLENAKRDFERAIEPIREHLPGMIEEIKSALSEIEGAVEDDDDNLIEEIKDALDDDDTDFVFTADESLVLVPEHGESYSKPLFSTTRDYLSQLDVYNAYNDGEL